MHFVIPDEMNNFLNWFYKTNTIDPVLKAAIAPDGFDGKFTTNKWAKIAKCSHDTALRDINALLEKKVLMKTESGGRSSGYLMAR